MTSTTGQPVTIPGVKDRHALFLEYYFEGDTAYNIRQSALKAGFSPNTAVKQGKRLLKTALTKQQNDLQALGDKDKTVLERDLNAKLKALNPVLKEVGIHLQDEEGKTPNIIPIQVNVESKNPDNKPHIREA